MRQGRLQGGEEAVEHFTIGSLEQAACRLQEGEDEAFAGLHIFSTNKKKAGTATRRDIGRDRESTYLNRSFIKKKSNKRILEYREETYSRTEMV